jgi:hypothetical protein
MMLRDHRRLSARQPVERADKPNDAGNQAPGSGKTYRTAHPASMRVIGRGVVPGYVIAAELDYSATCTFAFSASFLLGRRA